MKGKAFVQSSCLINKKTSLLTSPLNDTSKNSDFHVRARKFHTKNHNLLGHTQGFKYGAYVHGVLYSSFTGALTDDTAIV